MIQIFEISFDINQIRKFLNSGLKDLSLNQINLNFNSWPMNNPAYSQKPIRLVSVSEQGKYEIHPEGANFLSQIEKPLGVVSVAGLYRTGKSYLLNRMLLNKSSGFGVGSTINACTKGLWCWGTPIKGTTPDGQKINVIIVDSEGIGALDEDQNHDTKIFTLAVLSASTFIYNSVGSIDENALQNLSLVVNLSKNIQINAHSEDQEVDPEELAQYFPSFCWVVRDFSLQLINGNGDTITPTEYLQRSLALQKGFSDDIEDKNRIRRLLTTFFKNRECITLVRPLVNETKLQQLQKLELEELRPQFVEQVLQLRKKILQNLSPKKFKNQLLDGKMYLNVLTSYVSAINEGAVPNMENAWGYMCQEKCYFTYDNCCTALEKELHELEESIPFQTERINLLCDQIEEEILKKYLEDTKGMEKQAKDLFIELKQKVKSSIKDLKRKNEKESLAILKSYAFKNFQSIEKMMATGEFSKYQDYIKELNAFYASLVQSGPNLPNKEMIFIDFTKKAAIQGAELFIKSTNKSFESKRTLWEEEKSFMQKKTEELKLQLSSDISMKKEQLQQLDQQNTELLASLQACKAELQKIKMKQLEQGTRLTQQLRQKREQYEKQAQELLKQMNEVKTLLRQVEKEKYEMEKELQKANAIFELKEEQYVEEIAEYKRKEASTLTEMMKFRSQNQQKYDKLIVEVQSKMSEYKRKYEIQSSKGEEMREKIESMQHCIDNLQKKNLSITQNSQKQLSKIKEQYTTKTGTLEQEIVTLQSELTQLKQTNQMLSQKMKTREGESTRLGSQLQEKLLQQSAQAKKQKALYEQKINFLEMELKEIEETNRTNVEFYQSRVAELQRMNKEVAERFSEEKVREVQREVEGKFRAMQKMLQQEKYQMENELQVMRKQKSNLKFDLEMERKNKETELIQYKKVIETIENELTTYRHSRTTFQQTLLNEHCQKTAQLQYRIKELQMQLENYKQEAENYQAQRSNRSQEAIMQLKNYYELEKEKLQHKNLKEKEKYQKKIQQLINEYEEKIKQQTNNLQEEYQFLKEEFMAYQMESKQTVSMLQHQLDLKTKAYDSIETQYTEQKVFYEKKEIELVQKNEFLSDSLSEERQNMQKRIDDLSKEKSKIEKQLITLAHQKEEVTNLSKAKDDKLTSFETQLTELTKQLERTRQLTRNKESQLQNQFMEKIINYEKKIALNKQQNEFLLKKNQELEKFTENKSKAYEDKIDTLKTELQQAIKSNEEKRIKELNEVEDKYEKLKKSTKESQTAYIKRISSLEREFAIEQEKGINLETRLTEHKSSNLSLEQKLSSELSTLKVSFNEQKNSLIQKIDSLKQSLAQTETQKQSLNSEYEKEAILMQNKIKYLEDNKEKTRKEMLQKIKKFEQLLTKAEKERKDDKSTYQTAMTQQIKKLEKKQQEEVKQLTANYEKRENQMDERLKTLEAQNRKLSERVSSSTQFNSETSILQERRLNELQQSEKRLTKELESFKNSSKSQSNGTFLLYQKEKESLKSKLVEKEEKLRLAEKLKQEYFYELEKEKAKTNVEKESFVMKIEELKETISKYERDLEKYQRENEKLKVEKRASVSKIQLGRYSVNKSHFGSNNMTQRSGLQDSMSFLNVSVTSSIRDNKQGRSFSKMNKDYLKSRQSRESGEKLSEKNSEVGKEKENFNPILDEESFFGNYA